MISKNVLKLCCEDISKIENYDKAIIDSVRIWHCHHRLETISNSIITVETLKKANMYYHRPANELIFLSPSEHAKLHTTGERSNKVWLKKHLPEYIKQKISLSNKGKPKSEEHKQKLKLSRLGKKASLETRQKLSAMRKGKKLGPMSDITKKHISEAKKAKNLIGVLHWYNNGKKESCLKNCPMGWTKGRLTKRSKK